jgi:hypothetical protein
MAIIEGIDPRSLGQAGWGVILSDGADPEILEALRPLLDLRRTQAEGRFRTFAGVEGYWKGKDTKNEFLARNGAGPGPADPERVPYYLLLVGSFQEIPYRFQQQLDVQYAVGRLHFDSLAEYAAYAESVVAAERKGVRLQGPVVVFGVSHNEDLHTEVSANYFARPLADGLARRYPRLRIEPRIGIEASKARLSKLLYRDSAPALLITSGHGVVFSEGDPRAEAHQGALLCADWEGPGSLVSPDFYFSADDVTDEMQLCGMITLHYSSFSAGAVFEGFQPQWIPEAAGDRESRVASLAQRLLALPRGGALAVVGLVDYAWSYAAPPDMSQTQVLQSVVMRLLDGYPVGNALEYMNVRYAELSTDLSETLEEMAYGMQSDPWELAQMWMASNDARSFSVVGDPAARLQVNERAF